MDRLKADSPVPLYHQLRLLIKEFIDTEEWAPGSKIPSERELSERLAVSRATVRQAVASLVRDGLLVSRPGKGTFVNQPRFVQTINAFYSFSESLRRRNIVPGVRVIELTVSAATGKQERILQLDAGSRVYHLVRLRLGDDEPLLIERTILPAERFPRLDRYDFNERQLYSVLSDEYGVELGVAQEAYEPVVVDDFEASLLGVRAGAPALLIERLMLDRQGRPVEWTKGVFRGDRCRYYVELRVPGPDQPAQIM
ncbi:GntR family transcriptional regulator [Limnochorda pilosa]|uniref:GntR family transcriptional regulator n=1 Tax=Limnochorda pilosa TaxID=1555112 RepID=A0A0K2SMZ3_LIMPI|nr:GntR family transcriptional regulator [Limnochorda pilosa]BAS28174.1 GntR family transcriptional regulator [Limnochorda pilosa]